MPTNSCKPRVSDFTHGPLHGNHRQEMARIQPQSTHGPFVPRCRRRTAGETKEGKEGAGVSTFTKLLRLLLHSVIFVRTKARCLYSGLVCYIVLPGTPLASPHRATVTHKCRSPARSQTCGLPYGAGSGFRWGICPVRMTK